MVLDERNFQSLDYGSMPVYSSNKLDDFGCDQRPVVKVFKTSESSLTSIKFSDETTTTPASVATCGNDKKVRIFDVNSGKILLDLFLKQRIRAMDYVPDGIDQGKILAEKKLLEKAKKLREAKKNVLNDPEKLDKLESIKQARIKKLEEEERAKEKARLLVQSVGDRNDEMSKELSTFNPDLSRHTGSVEEVLVQTGSLVVDRTVSEKVDFTTMLTSKRTAKDIDVTSKKYLKGLLTGKGAKIFDQIRMDPNRALEEEDEAEADEDEPTLNKKSKIE